MLGLRRHRTDMSVVRCSLFCGGRTRVNSAMSVVADVHIVVNVHMLVVHVMKVSAHMPYRRVVEEMSMVPSPAVKARAEIAESVVDPAIKTDHRAPISVIENKPRTSPAPVRW